MYLFDTDTIITLLRGNKKDKLVQRIAELPFHRQFISSISLSELVYGAYCSQRPTYHLEMIRDVLLQNVQIANFDAPAAGQAGRLRATLRKLSQPLDFPDLQIAAIALDRQLILVTGNTRHFSRIPALRVENWMEY